MLESLSQFLTTLLAYIGYLLIATTFIAVGFAVGFFYPFKRRTGASAASKPEDIESELNYLTEAIGKTKKATAELLEKAQLRPQSNVRNQTAKQKSINYIAPGKLEKIKQLINKLFRRSHTEEPQDNSLVARLRNIKAEIKDITSKIESVKINQPSNVNPNVRDSQANWNKPTAKAVEKPATNVNISMEEDYSSWFSSGGQPKTSEPHAGLPQIVRTSDSDEEQSFDSRSIRKPTANIGSEMIELYNRAVTDTSAREQFRERYQPLRISTVNAVERRQNPTIVAEFRETTDGEFFAFAVPGTNQYAVVPRLGLTIEAVSYNAGALGQVFGDPRYNPGDYHSRYCVRRPATFKRDGEHWELHSPGELDLGPGD